MGHQPIFKGIATALLAELLEQGDLLGVEDYTLEVRAGNDAAQRLYLRQGFAPAGRRPNYYPCPGGRREDALLMRLQLQGACEVQARR